MRHWGRVHTRFALVYAVLIVIGRLTRWSENDIALWWPASGAAVLWALYAGRGRPLAVCAVAVVLLAGAGNAFTGLDPLASPWFGLANGAIALGAALASQVWARHVRTWTAGRPALRTPQDLVHLLVAGAGGVALSVPPMLVAFLGLDLDRSDNFVLEWITRNLIGVLAVSAPWLAWVDRDTQRVIAVPGDSRRPHRLWEGIFLVVLTAVAVVQVFVVNKDLPLVFLVIAASVWAGARFSPVFASMHAVAAVIGAALLLAAGAGGPLAMQDSFRAVIVIQAMGLVALVVSLFLALSAQERDLVSVSLRETEREARDRAELLATMTESMVDGLVVVDDRGRARVVNEAALALGADAWTRAAFKGLEDGGRFQRLDGTPLAPDEHPARRAFAEDTTTSVDLIHVDPGTAKKCIVFVSAATVGVGAGRAERLAVVLLRDVTARHRQLSQLQTFAGVVAHDLQNPLFASKGWAEVVSEGLHASDGVGPQVHDALRRTISSLTRAQLLVDDLLGFTRASTDSVELQSVDLDTLVEAEMAELRVRFGRPEAVLEKGDLGAVRMDPTSARQVFANLLGNSLKYAATDCTPRIDINVTRNGDGVRIDVSDNGPGIPEAHQQQIFEPFHRVHPDLPGTGLGLAICAQAMERHGGSICAHDGPGGVGVTFSLHLPPPPR